MNKEERATLRRAVERARRLLEDEVADQLEGAFGILQSGKVLDDAPGDPTVRQRLLELITHHQAGGETAKEAVERATRELAFTTLNRFVALKMAERRGLVRECISKGPLSDGIRELADCAPGLRAALPDGGYRLLLEAVMDEVSIGLSALFDRRAPAGLIWPRPKALDELLDILNAAELASLWEQDETIGWVYQYFNPKDEREAMRKASAAPRNSRELAVRNQFFTPRYVVAFLTDNTLGRIWYEMRKGDTALKESCRYLVRRPSEVFLEPGEPAPPSKDDEADLAQEELLRRPVYIEHRPKKDPRDIKVLDPACGSGHFLLYAFELLERIYEEAWADAESPASEATGRTLREDYGSIDELRRAAPKLIIEHNLHGIDIDPRAVQIAALALWLRAQKAWQGMGLKPTGRPQISRSNIVTAEPMPGEDDMRRELVDSLRPRVLGQLVDLVFERMRLAGEAGSLLKIEEEIKDGIAEARKQWLESSEGERQLLFPGMGPARPEQQKLRFDLAGVDNEQFWEEAESRILEALQAYSERAENGRAFRRRLFAEDAARGFAFVDLCRKRYDVVLMNPPFGKGAEATETTLRDSYPENWKDLYASFIERALSIIEKPGFIGCITSSQFLYTKQLLGLRRSILKRRALHCFIELGHGVLDGATVETALSILHPFLRNGNHVTTLYMDLTNDQEKGEMISLSCIDLGGFRPHKLQVFERISTIPFSFHSDPNTLALWRRKDRLEPSVARVATGNHTFEDQRFLRLNTEIPLRCVRSRWLPYEKGGEYQPFYAPSRLLVDWNGDGEGLRQINRERHGSDAQVMQSSKYWYRKGLCYSHVSSVAFGPRILPEGEIFSSESISIFIKGDDLYLPLLALLCSTWVQELIWVFGRYRKIENRAVSNLPISIPMINREKESLRELALKGISEVRRIESLDETSPIFCLPDAVVTRKLDSSQVRIDSARHLKSICDEIDDISMKCLYEKAKHVQPVAQRRSELVTIYVMRSAASGEDYSHGLLSYVIGCLFGRWDVRIASEPSLAPDLANPFDRLPVCPPGMLVGPDGLPAEAGSIVSEEWLRARPDALALPSEGTVKQATIKDSEYAIQVSWDGILVDDPGLDGNYPRRDDIVLRVREALEVVWKDKAHEIEQEACEMLGVSTLRDYFRKPSGFFDDHLKRYSKSRRKAPIYWPLSTASGAYTVWVYYHRLTDDTLYRIVSDYVSPKISQVEDRITQREGEHRSAQGRDAARLAKELSELTSLLQELKELRDELLRVAHLPYKPDLNDGVQITAAPLWRLFRLPRWRSELERTWQALERGDYDWAHLAYAIWPERVQEACRRDRSIAIAHGLEELYQERSAPQRPARRRRGQAG